MVLEEAGSVVIMKATTMPIFLQIGSTNTITFKAL
jgi:hypothetical protein